MTSALWLADRLATLDDDGLHRFITAHKLAHSRAADFFDLAEAALEPSAVQRVLARLDRPTLALLAALAEHPGNAGELGARLAGDGASRTTTASVPARLERLAAELLIEIDDGTASTFPQVRKRLAAWPDDGLPTAAQLASQPAPVDLAAVSGRSEQRERTAAHTAFTAVGAVRDLLAALEDEPARELRKGGVTLPDAKRISARLGLPIESVPTVLWCARHAELTHRDGDQWFAARRSARWSRLPTAAAWAELASAWRDAIPAGVLGLLTERGHMPWGTTVDALLRWWFPAADDALLRHAVRWDAAARFLGITTADATSDLGLAVLEGGTDAAEAAASDQFPPEVTGVYIQRDLSIVAPGPLTPALDARLRHLAVAESRDLATTYRVSRASLERALAAGETEKSITDFLAGISLSGIPQPVAYLISDAASRQGRIRLRPGRSSRIIWSGDAALIAALEVDRALAGLRLRRLDANNLTTSAPLESAYRVLADAGYPVAAEGSSGRLMAPQPHSTAPQHRETGRATAELIRRLRSARARMPDSEHAWMRRQLDAAARSRATLIVTVALPDGRTVDWTLEPTGISGGRLRGRDRRADLERTVPLASIVGVRAP